jgi:hypothetical protein
MINSTLIKTVVEAYLAANPKARKEVLEPAVEKIMHAIQHINTLDEYAVQYSDTELLSQVKIPNELRDLVLPSEVRRDVNNIGSKKLLVHDDFNGSVPSVSELYNAIATVRMSQRKGVNDDLVDVTSLRTPVNLTDVWDRAVFIDSKITKKVGLKNDKGEDTHYEDKTGVALRGHSDGKVAMPIVLDSSAFATEEEWYLSSNYFEYDAIIKNFISSKVSGLN